MKLFDGDYEYAHSRLSGTYVWVEKLKQLLYTVSVTAPGTIELVDRSADKRVRLPVDAISFEPPVLGAFELNNRAYWPARTGVRRDWKQGLRQTQFVCYSSGSPSPQRIGDFLDQSIESVTESILGVRKRSFTSVLQDLEEYCLSLPVGKRLIVTNSFQVFYRGFLAVGRVTADDRVSLLPKYSYLAEEIQEELGEDALVR